MAAPPSTGPARAAPPTTAYGGEQRDIGRNSDGGNAGPITLNSTFGNIAVAGVLILRGAIASNSGDRTGDGGTQW